MAQQKQTNLNLYQKLALIRKQVEVVAKNKSGFNYRYVSDDELLAKITVFMRKHHVSLIPRIVPGTLKHEQYNYEKTKMNRSTKAMYDEKNSEIIVSADMTFTWVNDNNPEEVIEVPWTLIGQQADSSQAFGSALTYSMRYFLLKYFNVATPDDDVDQWRSKQRAAEVAEDRAIAAQLVSEFDGAVRKHLEANPDDSEKIKTMVKKYVKSGNYFTITESALIQSLLEDFNTTFSKAKAE